MDHDEALALFKKHVIVRGMFEAVTGPMVTKWEEAGELRTRPGIAAHFREAKARSPVQDFRGRTVTHIEPGDYVYDYVAWDESADLRDLFLPGTHYWVEDWVEYSAAWSGLGLSLAATKIRSNSSILGVWTTRRSPAPPLPAIEREALAILHISVPLPAITRAISALEREGMTWADHYSHYNVRNSWSAVALRGYGAETNFIIKPAEMSKKWKGENPQKLRWAISDTELRARLPEFEPLIDLIPGRKERVRLMRLAAGGELSRHADITDPDAGTNDGQLMRIHIPLVTNPEVIFTQWLLDGSEKRAHMEIGEAWYLDDRKPHAAKNAGAADRIHLVMDVEANETLRGLVGHPDKFGGF